MIQNKTVIVVAHRLNMLWLRQDCGSQEGKDCRTGESMKNYLIKEGMYKELWDYQEKVKNWQITNTVHHAEP